MKIVATSITKINITLDFYACVCCVYFVVSECTSNPCKPANLPVLYLKLHSASSCNTDKDTKSRGLDLAEANMLSFPAPE